MLKRHVKHITVQIAKIGRSDISGGIEIVEFFTLSHFHNMLNLTVDGPLKIVGPHNFRQISPPIYNLTDYHEGLNIFPGLQIPPCILPVDEPCDIFTLSVELPA